MGDVAIDEGRWWRPGAVRRVGTVARLLLGLSYVGGALVHVVFGIRSPAVYAEITPFVLFSAYRSLWTTVVLPNLVPLLAVLVAFEALLGVVILRGGTDAKWGLLVGAGVQLALAPLGFWWPANVALALVHVGVYRSMGPVDVPTHGAVAD